MNQVMRHAGMMRQLNKQRLKNLATLALVGEGAVGFWGGDAERESMENRGLLSKAASRA